MNKSSNPVLKRIMARSNRGEGVMTIGGTVAKTGILLLLLIATSLYSYNETMKGVMGFPVLIGCLIGAFGISWFALSVPRFAGVAAPFYAGFEGIVLGFISAIYAAKYDGIVFQAIGMTFAVMAVMLVLYRTGILRPTRTFQKVLVIASLSVLLFYVVLMILPLFGVVTTFYVGGGALSIGLSVIISGIAALHFINDFGMIDAGVQNGASKDMEWIGALGLVLTIVWLYLELLRLISKFQK